MRLSGLFFGSRAAAGAPTAPSGLSANAVSDSRIDTSWTDNSDDEDQFRIQYDTDSGFPSPSELTVGANVTSRAVTGLAASTQYFFRVRAENAAGNSAWSNTANATTDASAPPPPSTPGGNDLVTVSPSRLDQSWNNVADEDEFRAHLALNSSFSSGLQTAVLGENVLSKAWTGLAEGTEYFARVRACNSGGCSAWSSTASVFTKLATPTLSGCNDGTNRLIISYSGNATNIQIFRNGSLYDTIANPAGTTTYTPAAQTGSWKVKAVASGVPDSDFSSEITMPFSGPCPT